jgi:hypothetical protein
LAPSDVSGNAAILSWTAVGGAGDIRVAVPNS